MHKYNQIHRHHRCERERENREVRFLSQLLPGESGVIVKVRGFGAFRKRIIEMGFVKGKRVNVIKQAPLNDPMEYEIMGYNVSLRRSEAALIEVVSESENNYVKKECYRYAEIEHEQRAAGQGERGKTINIALVGNPNCGKTTLFNHVTGAHERVGNYGGVTIEAKEGVLDRHGYRFNIVDLPGTYSITEYTPEELYVRDHLLINKPDVVVNIVDASNLERNLYLTTQLIDMNIKVVIALNMYDEIEKKGIQLDHKKLGKLIGIPLVPTIASKGKGLDKLFKTIIDVYQDHNKVQRHIHINHGNDIEGYISQLQQELKKIDNITEHYCTRYIAIKLLEREKSIEELFIDSPHYSSTIKEAKRLSELIERQYLESPEAVITDAKYGFIDGALKECMQLPEKPGTKIHHLDDLLTHKYLGLPIFIIFLWLMFQTTFSLGSYPMELIEYMVALAGKGASAAIPDGPLQDMIVNGVIDGVGGVIVFLPNILILFFFISFMEDSGYMARAAFIMDKLMHKIGLHGKSFIPLIMGFGCNVPAVMATRTLENKSDRILTMLIVPFMSCSARLPVYVLLISAFFPKNQGLVLASIYLIGIIMAILLALALKKIVFNKEETPFVMELPPYRIPTIKSTSMHMWHKAWLYLKKMGTVILVASIIVWALGYFPIEKGNNGEIKGSSSLEQSYIGKIGHAIEPIMEPLGFDWKMGVSIISGLPAKEIVVSTMSVLYQAEEGEEQTSSLIAGLKEQVHRSGKLAGQKVFDPVVAFAFMIFILIYFPCIATIVAIGKEAGWGWALFSLIYTSLLAWIMAFAVYRIGGLLFY